MDLGLLGMVTLLVSVVVVRILDERAVKTLDDTQRDLLADRYARSRALGLLPLLGLAIAYALIAPRIPDHAGLLGLVFGAVAIVLVGVLHITAIKKLRDVGLPVAYIGAWNVARAVQYAGLLAGAALLGIAKLGLA